MLPPCDRLREPGVPVLLDYGHVRRAGDHLEAAADDVRGRVDASREAMRVDDANARGVDGDDEEELVRVVAAEAEEATEALLAAGELNGSLPRAAVIALDLGDRDALRRVAWVLEDHLLR